MECDTTLWLFIQDTNFFIIDFLVLPAEIEVAGAWKKAGTHNVAKVDSSNARKYSLENST